MADETRNALRLSEDRNVRALLQAYDGLADELFASLGAEFARMGITNWDFVTMKALGRDTALLRDIIGQIERIRGQLDVDTENALIRLFQEEAFRQFWMFDKSTPEPVIPKAPVVDAAGVRALISTPWEGAMFSDRIGLITTQMANDLQIELTRSMIAGESIADASERLEGIIGTARGRAEMIARTEIIRAMNLAREDVFEKNADVIVDKVWKATLDDITCPICAPLDGTGEDEWSEDEDGADGPPAHPNCRCVLIPVMKSFRDLGVDVPEGLGDEEMAVRDPTTGKTVFQKYEPYSKWAERMGAPTDFFESERFSDGKVAVS